MIRKGPKDQWLSFFEGQAVLIALNTEAGMDAQVPQSAIDGI